MDENLEPPQIPTNSRFLMADFKTLHFAGFGNEIFEIVSFIGLAQLLGRFSLAFTLFSECH